MTPCANPLCRSTEPGKRRKGLCPNCYDYRRRYGRQRDPALLHKLPRPDRLPIPGLPALLARYEAGETLDALAAEAGCSPSTLVRRFHQLGVRKQPRISDEEVRRIRYRHFHGEEPISQIARSLGLHFNTVWNIVSGRTRLEAGGPIAARRQKGQRPCIRCGVLTTTRLCHLCRAEGHSPEENYARYPA